ncbi:MAG: PQQ-binding-like beta-propeller repeat protein [bacterium]
MRKPFAMSLVIILCLAVAAGAVPKVETEVITDISGNQLTRCVTPGSETGEMGIPQIAPHATDQEVLWTVDHGTAIAHDVAVSGDGGYLTTGWYLNYEKVSMYEVAGTGTPLWEYTITPNFYLPVAASDDNAVVASIGDIVPLNAWLNGAGPTPSWSYNPPVGWKGTDCDVSDNGMYIVASYKEDGTDNGKLLVFASTGGAPLWEIDFNAQNGINGIEISEDNNWIVISTYYAYHVFDFTNLLLFASVTNYSQTTGGIDDDAEYLATGDFYGQLHLYQRTGTGYTQLWQSYMGGWVTAVDVSSDASMVIAGNYTYSPSNAGEVRGYDIGGTQLWSYAQYGDYIADAALCNDGSVGVATSWGALNYTFGDIFTAFDMATGDVIFNLLDDIDEPGTLFDVAISDDGTIAVSGGKAVHARTFGNGGQIYAIELGGGVSPMTLDLTYVSGSPVPAGGGNVD